MDNSLYLEICTVYNREMWEILVPTIMINPHTKELGPIKVRYHRVWDERVRNISGGLTVFIPAKGQWVSPVTNHLYLERMIPVRILATDEEMDHIVKMTAVYYNQEAIMAYKISSRVVLYQNFEYVGA